ncbi:MAG TPA: hypothetical protein VMI54_23140 [Polyangiaceae bacterium]|nr:hypothetical protein [Polyangiaceae bacterium]
MPEPRFHTSSDQDHSAVAKALSERRRDQIAVVGLGVGGLFGMAGSFVGQATLRQLFWMLDGVGIVVASALLAVKFFREGKDGLAAGFLVFLAAESLVLSETTAGLEASRASFASGVALWAASLLTISVTSTFPKWSRLTGLIAAALFTVTAVKIACGAGLVATSAPLPSAGYPFLVLTFVGWIRTLLAAPSSARAGTPKLDAAASGV